MTSTASWEMDNILGMTLTTKQEHRPLPLHPLEESRWLDEHLQQTSLLPRLVARYSTARAL
jgi:hypothetical protein